MYEKQAKETLALKKGEENVVRKLLGDGFEVDDVLKYTTLSKSHIMTLVNNMVLK